MPQQRFKNDDFSPLISGLIRNDSIITDSPVGIGEGKEGGREGDDVWFADATGGVVDSQTNLMQSASAHNRS